MTWHTLYDAALAAEPVSRVEWTLTPANDDATVTRVTLRHLDLARSPGTWANVRLGWVGVLDSMKTLLETGDELGDVDTGERPSHTSRTMCSPSGTAPRASRPTTRRGSCSTVARTHRPKPTICSPVRTRRPTTGRVRLVASPPTRRGVRGWCRGHTPSSVTVSSPFTTPTSAPRRARPPGSTTSTSPTHTRRRARALACLGRLDEARVERKAARAVDIVDAEDRAIVESDLAAEPWFGLSDD